MNQKTGEEKRMLGLTVIFSLLQIHQLRNAIFWSDEWGAPHASVSTLTLIKGALKIMAWAKVQTVIAIGSGALLATSITTMTIEKLLPDGVDDRWFVTDARVLNKIPDNITIIRPTHFGNRGGSGSLYEPDRMVSYNEPLDSFIIFAESFSDPVRQVFPDDFPKEVRFDVLITLPKDQKYNGMDKLKLAVKDQIKKQFGFVWHREKRDYNALVLRVKNPDASGLHRNVKAGDLHNTGIQSSVEGLNSKNFPLNYLAYQLEYTLQIPVIDQTGLTNHVALDLQWKKLPGEEMTDTVKRVVSDDLGLEFFSTNISLETLVIEKTRRN